MTGKHKHKPVRKLKVRRVSSKELSHQIDDMRSEMGKMLSELVSTRDRLITLKADMIAVIKMHAETVQHEIDKVRHDVRASTRVVQRVEEFLNEDDAKKNAQNVSEIVHEGEKHEAQAQS